MIKFSKFALMLVALFAIILVSCDETTSPTSTALKVNSLSAFTGKTGDTLTIKGTGFGASTDTGYVAFGSVLAPPANYLVWSDTEIKVVVPTIAASGWSYVQVMGKNVLSEKFDFYTGNYELGATSLDSTSVRLFFSTPQSPNANTTFEHYVYTVRNNAGATIINEKTITSTNGAVDIAQLMEGEVYTFEISAMYKNGAMSKALSVKWSPASRFTVTSNGVTIKLYESASKNGSGLDFYDKMTNSSEVLNVAAGASWNLGLDTKDANNIKFSSAKVIGYNFPVAPQSAQLSTSYYEATSLNDVSDSKALSTNSFEDGSHLLTDLEAEAKGKSIIFIARTIEPGEINYNYAKIFIKNVGGKFLQGTTPDRYIEVQVSYQKKVNIPYAKK